MSKIQTTQQYNALMERLNSGEFDDRPQVKAQLVREAAGFHSQYQQQQAEVRAQELAQKVKTDPVGAAQQGQIGGADFLATRGFPQQRQAAREQRLGTQLEPSAELLYNNAREAGVDISTGFPKSERFAVAAAANGNEDREVAVLDHFARKALTDAGIDLPPEISAVTVDSYTGKLAYYRPEQNDDGSMGMRLTLVNPPGLEAGDMIAASPAVAQAVMEAGGSFAGASAGALAGRGQATLMTLGASVGSGTMAALANKARQEIARGFGVPDELVERIQSEDMFRDVMFAAGGDALFGAAAGVYRGWTNTFRRPLNATPDELAKIRQEMIEAGEDFEKFEELFGDKLNLNIAMLSDNPELLVMQAQIESAAKDSVGRELAESSVGTRLTVGSAVRRLNSQEFPTAGAKYKPIEQGKRAQDVVQEPVRVAEGRAADAQAAVNRRAAALPTTEDKPWVELQDLARRTGEEYRTTETARWADFTGELGINVNPKNGRADIWVLNAPNSAIRRTVNGLSERAQQTLAPIYKHAQEKFLRDLGIDPASRKALQAEMPSLMDDSLDLRQLHILMSYLKQQSKNLDTAAQVGWTMRDINEMIGAIERQIRNSPLVYNLESPGAPNFPATRPRVSKDIEKNIKQKFWDANDATRRAYDYENFQALSTLSEMRRSPATGQLEFVQQPDAIRSLFLRPGNSNALAELRELRGLSPELKTGLRQEMLALYRRATLDANGNFQREAANRFLNEYRSHLKLLFGDRADDLISIQRMATEATRLENRAKTVQTAVRETFGQKWASNATTPDEVVRELMSGKFQEEQISRFASRVRRADPQLWEDIQQQGLRWIENYTTTGKSGQEINWRGLDRLLQGSNRDKLVTMYGAKYVDNLGTIRDVARRVAGETMGETFATNVQSPLLQVSRSLLGPLSKKQRFITSTNRLMKAMGNAHFRKMMAQPDALDQWIKINRPEPGTFAAASALMEAPGYMWDAADDETRELAEKIRAARATRQFSSQPTGQ